LVLAGFRSGSTLYAGVVAQGFSKQYSVRHLSLTPLNNLGSSFDNSPMSTLKHSNLNLFAHYLAGLIEGDGSIVVPKVLRDNKGRKTYPSIQIAFHR